MIVEIMKHRPHTVKPAIEQMYQHREDRVVLIEKEKLKQKLSRSLKNKVRGKLIKKGLQKAIDDVLAAESLDELSLEQEMTVHFMHETLGVDDSQPTMVPKTRIGANVEKTVEMLQQLTRSAETDISKLQAIVLQQDMAKRQQQRFERGLELSGQQRIEIVGSRNQNFPDDNVEIKSHQSIVKDLIDKVYKGEL